MSELQLIFLLIGAGLFLFVVAYSILMKKQQSMPKKARATFDSVEPIVSDEPPVSVKSNQAEVVDEPELPPVKEKISLTQKLASRVTRKVEGMMDEPADPVMAHPEENQAPEKLEVRVNAENVVDINSRSTPDEGAANSNGKPKLDPATSMAINELVAKVKNPLPVEQHELLTLFRMHDYKFNRTVHIFGLNQLTEKWRDIEYELPSARFVELGVSIELADRDGAMTQKELHDFQQMVLEFTNKFDAPFEFSMEIDDAFEQGQALDDAGRRYDSMAVLNIVPKTVKGFRAADIESCARDLMMSSDKKGIFLKTVGQKDNISVLYRLACVDAAGNYGSVNQITSVTNNLVIYMNVPATKSPNKVFEEMAKDANSLATWLEGKVIDQNGNTLNERSYVALMQQIIDISNNMKADGLTPGDTVSKKLF